MEITSGDKRCSCSLPNSVEVTILGKTFYGWYKDKECQTGMVALQVKEKWHTEPKWSCTCNTPEEAEKMHVQENMLMLPMVENPELANHTMIFPSDCSEASSLKEGLQDPAELGPGSYQWTFRSGKNEPSDPGQRARATESLAQDQSTWIDDEPWTMGQCLPGMWGPPWRALDGRPVGGARHGRLPLDWARAQETNRPKRWWAGHGRGGAIGEVPMFLSKFVASHSLVSQAH